MATARRSPLCGGGRSPSSEAVHLGVTSLGDLRNPVPEELDGLLRGELPDPDSTGVEYRAPLAHPGGGVAVVRDVPGELLWLAQVVEDDEPPPVWATGLRRVDD